jgi:proteic killer suppression protein
MTASSNVVPRRSLVDQVILAFSTKALRSLCECQAKAERQLGFKVAKKLRERLADIRAASNVTDLVAGRPCEIEGGRLANYAINLADGYRMVLCANHNGIPLAESRRIDWSKVSRVRIHRIEVAHE